MHKIVNFLLIASSCILISKISIAAEPGVGAGIVSNNAWDKLSGTLLQLLAVVIVVESALSALFQWRIYRMAFNAHALKTPIMFLIGLILVVVTPYDPMQQLLLAAADTGAGQGAWRSYVTVPLSALIIAGGSAGIYALLRKFKIRASDDEVSVKDLRDDQAYISMRLIGAPKDVVVHVGIDELDAAANDSPSDKNNKTKGYLFDHNTLPPLAGTLDNRSFRKRLHGGLLADAARLPNYGGRKVRTDKYYNIIATWIDPSAARDAPAKTVNIYRGRFAPRAFIDIRADITGA